MARVESDCRVITNTDVTSLGDAKRATVEMFSCTTIRFQKAETFDLFYLV